ncbi:MAG TPA: hypothetical protein VLF89_05240 [Candidatus Saccharimonadales bacterium]|nr:hypothetical protein [Candidatus Saccharimonadales bacterium]
MQVTAVSVNAKKEGQDSSLKSYLHFMGWDTQEFTNEKLESMLAASCLRFLEGLTDLSFVIGLSEHILKKQKKSDMNLSLHYATEILHNLSEKLQNHSISDTDKHTIQNYIDDAQEVITSRRYLTPVS